MAEGTGLTLALVVVFATLMLPPLLLLVAGSFATTLPDGSRGPLTLDNYVHVLNQPSLLLSTWNTFVFAAGSAVLAIVLGGVQAWAVERTDAPLKWLAWVGAVVSLATPYILYVIGVMYAFGKLGPIASLTRWLTGEAWALDMQTMTGMIIVEGLLWTPLVFLMLAPVMRVANPHFEEAALMSGASHGQTLARITLRLLTPALIGIVLLVFIRGVEAFEVPAIVGMPGNVTVLTTEIFLHLKMAVPPDLGRASAFAVVLLVLVAALLMLYHRVLAEAQRYQTITGKGYRPRVTELGRWRWTVGSLLLANFAICVALPVISLVWTSLMPFYQMMSMRALGRMTLRNYELVLTGRADLDALWNTFALAFATASITMALAGLAGWIIARSRPGAGVLDQLGSVPLVFPGLVLAVAIMQEFLWVPLPIYGTLWILLVAFTIRYMPYGLRYGTAGVVQVHHELEEAAVVSGAGLAHRLGRVVTPLIAPALLSGWLFIFLLTARDLSMPVLLSNARTQVVSVLLYDKWVNGQAPELAAFGLVWMALMTAVASTFLVLMRRLGGGLEP